MEELRDNLHRKGLNLWRSNKYKGTLLYGTGSGKTWCAIRAMSHFYNEHSKYLVVVPRTTLFENWKNEIKKAGKEHLIKHIDFICYHSINKYNKEIYHLVVLDEVHHVTSEKRMEFLKQNDSLKILGLTASLTPLQKYKLFKYIPVVDEYSIEVANKDGIVSDFEIYTIPVDLTTEERIKYNLLSNKSDAYYKKTGGNNWKAIGDRTRILHNAENKITIGKELNKLFENEYGVIFSLSIDVSNKLSEIIPNCKAVHSKISKKKIPFILKDFADPDTPTNTLATPTMLDEGITLPKLSYSIMLSRYSKERQTIQTIGRNVRKDDNPNKLAILVRVYCRNTVEEKWVNKSFNQFKVTKLNNYEEFRDIIKEKRKNI